MDNLLGQVGASTSPTMPGDPQTFWSRVAKTDGCWFWLGGLIKGYGTTSWGGQPCAAHRLAWRLTFGAWPVRHLHHTCRTPSCVRPDHLREVTPAEHHRLHSDTNS